MNYKLGYQEIISKMKSRYINREYKWKQIGWEYNKIKRKLTGTSKKANVKGIKH